MIEKQLVLRALLWVCLAACVSGADCKEHEVYLPPDTDVLTVVGNGFKLELTQFKKMKEFWEDAARSSNDVSTPKTMGESAKTRPTEGPSELATNEQQAPDERHLAAEQPVTHHRRLCNYLSQWIDNRVTALIERLERYSDEMPSAKSEGEKVVMQILQLNTISQLEDLVKEGLSDLDWLQKKLKALENMHRFDKTASYSFVSQYVRNTIKQCVDIEANTKGTNNPGADWLKKSSAAKRVMDEQRFASSLNDDISDFFTSEFAMMKRSIVLNILQGAQQVDNGLFYWAAKGRVSADFPFSAQDAIANGAIY